MRFTGYKGPYKDGFPTRRIADDGTVWREATPGELADPAPDLLIFWGRGEPEYASKYRDFYLPGDYPLLAGLAALMPVYVMDGEQPGEKTGESPEVEEE